MADSLRLRCVRVTGGTENLTNSKKSYAKMIDCPHYPPFCCSGRSSCLLRSINIKLLLLGCAKKNASFFADELKKRWVLLLFRPSVSALLGRPRLALFTCFVSLYPSHRFSTFEPASTVETPEEEHEVIVFLFSFSEHVLLICIVIYCS